MPRARKPRIGLALGAGGARGWSHIGVIRALQDAGIQADVVCGTSIGALIAASYASGTLDGIEEWAQGLGWRDVFGLVDLTWRGGLIRGERVFELIRTRTEDRDIRELPIPFAAVATELHTGQEVWLREGKVLDAVRASVAIPGVFAPVRRSGQLLVDGGLVNPVPVSLCRALGAEVVIAVDLGWSKLGYYRERGRESPDLEKTWSGWWRRIRGTPLEGEAPPEPGMPSVLDVFLSSVDVMQVRVGRSRLAGDPADALITPILPNFGMMDFHRAKEAIEEGRAATTRARATLEHLLGA